MMMLPTNAVPADEEKQGGPLRWGRSSVWGAIASGLASVAIAGIALPAQAQSCTPLEVVNGRGETEVTKTVSPPSALVTRSNWNTDFSVPNGANYSRYVATVRSRSQDNGEFTIAMNLKYSNGGADRVHDGRRVAIAAGDSITITGNPRNNQQPFQVNLEVGGTRAIGITYSLTVSGCR